MSLFTLHETVESIRQERIAKIKERIESLIRQSVPKGAPEMQVETDRLFFEWGVFKTRFYNRISASLLYGKLHLNFTDSSFNGTNFRMGGESTDISLDDSDKMIVARIRKFWKQYAPKKV